MSGTVSDSFDINNPGATRVIPAQRPDMLNMPSSDDDDGTLNVLDTPPFIALHSRLKQLWLTESMRQRDNRVNMAIDEDFYDGIQWTEEEMATLRERGQAATVLNVISQTINWITGTERRGRSDFKVLPRRQDGEAGAIRKTELLKYMSDVTDLPFLRSRAFKDAVVAGVGWLEDCLAEDEDTEIITTRYETWRNMLWDSASVDLGLRDCRYVIRMKWLDVDVALSRYPDRQDVIRNSVGNNGGPGEYLFADEVADQMEYDREQSIPGMGNGSGNIRPRVRVIEIWYRTPQATQVLAGSEFHGEVFDPYSPGHVAAVNNGQAEIRTRNIMRMSCAIFASNGILWAGASPYRHNEYPFTPLWAYRYGRNQLPYSIVRGLKHLQEDINKRFSKSLFILSTNKVIVEKGAIPNMQEFMREVNRPDGVIQVGDGKMAAIKLDVDREMAPAHLDLMKTEMAMVQTVGGVTDEMMGRTTNATSGTAIQSRQSQGMMVTAEVFDNLRLSFKLQGEKQLSLVEQFFTEKKQFRITNSRGQPQYVTINDGLPENDITRTKADYVIGEADWRITVRQSMADALMDLVKNLPGPVALTLLDLVVEEMDLPNADEIVKRIRQVTGMQDPDQNNVTPEQQAEQQQKQQMQAVQQQIAIKEAVLKLQSLEANNNKTNAQAQQQTALTQQILANADLLAAQAVKTRADTMGAATVAAQASLGPGIPQVADAILGEAGFQPGPVPSVMDTALARAQAEQQGLGLPQGAAPPQQQPPQQQAAPQQRIIRPADENGAPSGLPQQPQRIIRPADENQPPQAPPQGAPPSPPPGVPGAMPPSGATGPIPPAGS